MKILTKLDAQPDPAVYNRGAPTPKLILGMTNAFAEAGLMEIPQVMF
jgi:hypothetical protein